MIHPEKKPFSLTVTLYETEKDKSGAKQLNVTGVSVPVSYITTKRPKIKYSGW